MGLIKAAVGAAGGVLADQWKEFFYCEAIPRDTLVIKGQKRITSRSSNTKGNDNIISNGSGIAVADGQSLYNGSEVLSGTITDMSKLDGKTLRPYKTITLADAADNSSAIREWNGSVADVTLTGRTLYKDGDWRRSACGFDSRRCHTDGTRH